MSTPDSEFLVEAIRTALSNRPNGLSVARIQVAIREQGIDVAEPRLLKTLTRSAQFVPLGRSNREWILNPANVAPATEPGLTRRLLPTPYPWQTCAVESWEASGHRGIVEAVTGSGKSWVGLQAVFLAARSQLRSLILVPSLALMDQWIHNLERQLPGIRVARLSGGQSHPAQHRADVVVATPHSLRGRSIDFLFPEKSLLLADEAHHYAAETFRHLLDVPFAWRLGLSATLERSDNLDQSVLLPRLGPIVFSLSYREALAQRAVAPFSVTLAGVRLGNGTRDAYNNLEQEMARLRASFARASNLDVNDVRQLESRLAAKAMSTDPLSELAKDYQRLKKEVMHRLDVAPEKLNGLMHFSSDISRSGGCLVFCESVALAQAASMRLQSDNLIALPLTGNSTEFERGRLLHSLAQREIHVLCAPRVLDEGIDVPNVDYGVVLSASRMRRQMVQRMGRVIRLGPDKRSATFVFLYGLETREDPNDGGHETFFDEVLPIAASVSQIVVG